MPTFAFNQGMKIALTVDELQLLIELLTLEQNKCAFNKNDNMVERYQNIKDKLKMYL